MKKIILILICICSVNAEYGNDYITKQLIVLNKNIEKQNKLLQKLIDVINTAPADDVVILNTNYQTKSDTEYLKYNYKPKKNAPYIKAIPTNFDSLNIDIIECKANCISKYGSSWSGATEEENCELECERNNYE